MQLHNSFNDTSTRFRRLLISLVQGCLPESKVTFFLAYSAWDFPNLPTNCKMPLGSRNRFNDIGLQAYFDVNMRFPM